jgi:hypothetical protein
MTPAGIGKSAAVQEAMIDAARQWPPQGTPDNPTGWGRQGLEQRVADAWQPFREWIDGWLQVIPVRGLEGARRAYLEVIEGGVDPRRAHVVSLA